MGGILRHRSMQGFVVPQSLFTFSLSSSLQLYISLFSIDPGECDKAYSSPHNLDKLSRRQATPPPPHCTNPPVSLPPPPPLRPLEAVDSNEHARRPGLGSSCGTAFAHPTYGGMLLETSMSLSESLSRLTMTLSRRPDLTVRPRGGGDDDSRKSI